MASKMMWMGPRGGEMWVPAPASGNDFTPVGWSSKTQYLGGGAGVRTSQSSHMEYAMAWNQTTRDKLRPIRDMYSGKRGPGLIYFIDPMAAAFNVLPEAWAFPAQACYDAVPLIGDSRPSNVPTSGNNLDYPMESAQYALTGASRSVYIPLPPGYAAWFGVHGESNGAGGVRVRETNGASGYGAEVFPAFLETADATRFSNSFVGCTGIEIDLAAPAVTPATSVTLSGMMVQVLPIGVAPAAGPFVSGQGNSGCRFESAPTVTAYSSVIDGAEVGMSAKLTEVGDSL